MSRKNRALAPRAAAIHPLRRASGAPVTAAPRYPGVPAEQVWTHRRGERRAQGQKRPERQRVFHSAAPGHDESDADDRAGDRRHHQRHEGELPADERADHGEHLHVAHAEPFFMAHAIVDFRDQPQHPPPTQNADERGQPARLGDQAEREADDDARQRDRRSAAGGVRDRWRTARSARNRTRAVTTSSTVGP